MAHFGRNQWLNLNKNYWITLIGINGSILQEFALIRSSDGKMFGSSGEAIKEMKIFYQDQTNDERMIVEQVINKLMKNFTEPQENLKIIPLIEVKKQIEESNVN